jgi:hypothetical protein
MQTCEHGAELESHKIAELRCIYDASTTYCKCCGTLFWYTFRAYWDFETELRKTETWEPKGFCEQCGGKCIIRFEEKEQHD